MRNLRTKLSDEVPTLVVSNTSAEEHMWVVDGAAVSMGSEAIWVLKDVSLRVEIDTGQPIKAPQLRGLLDDLQDGLQSAYALEMIELETPSAVTKTTTIEPTTAIETFVHTDKPTVAYSQSSSAGMYIVLGIIGVLFVAAGGIILIWFLCRKFKSVNIFVDAMSKYRKVKSKKRRRNSRLVMVEARVRPSHSLGPATTKYNNERKIYS